MGKPTPEEIRAAMPPEMLKALDELKRVFGASKLKYFETPTIKLGKDIENV
jgi:hypothetical protein